MFLFLKYDGSIELAPTGFELESPDWDQLREVQEVLQVGKAYTKQMKLVAKPKEERAVVRDAISAAAKVEVGEAEPVKQRLKRK